MKKFKLFDESHFKLINKRRKSKINIKSDNEARVKKSIKKQAKRKRKKNKENFLNQFDTLMFTHSDEEPHSFNSGQNHNLTRDLDFQNNYSRFAMKNMHYGVTNREDFTHNNMTPNSSRRDFEVNNGTYQDRKLQIQSGSDRTFQHKKEIAPLFEPTKNLSNVYGAPVMTNELKNRYIPDKQKNFSELPFENKVKILPGINGMNQVGRNKTYRIMPKTIDQLKSKNNQKKIYKTRKIHAIKKGEMRGPIPTITKDKLPTYKKVNFNDLVANKATVTKQSKRGLFKKSNSHRSTANNYINPAKNSNMGSGPSKNKSKYKKSSKITLHEDNQRNVSNVINKNQIQNKKSYKAYNTQRITTNYEEKGHVNNSTMGSYTNNPNDIPLTTLRELMIHNDNITGIKGSNTREYVFSKDMIMPNTNRQNYTTTNYPQGISSNVKSIYANNQDRAKNTTRQTTQFNNYQGNARDENGNSYVRDKNDKAKSTTRQTTQFNNYQGNARDDIGGGYTRDPNAKTRNTIKESTLFNVPEMNVVGATNSNYTRIKGDFARHTVKESTLTSHPAMNISSMHQDSYHRNKGEKAKPTIKQTTLHSTPHMNLKNVFTDGSYKRSKNDIAKRTIRETTAHTNYTGNLVGEVHQPRDRTDANNMNIDDRREILTYNRLPGGKHDGPYIVDKGGYELKEEIKYNREYINKHQPVDRNIIDQDLNTIYSRNKDKVKKIESEYRINYNYINQMEKNPYTNNLVHQKNK